MATIPQIAMGFRQPEIASPLNMMAQVSQIQAAQDANALRQLQMQQALRQQEQENALAAMPYGTLAATPQEALRYGAPGRQLYESLLKGSKEKREAELAEARIAGENIKTAKASLGGVSDQSTFDAWRANTVRLLPGLAGALPTTYSPEAVRKLALDADKLYENVTSVLNLGRIQTVVQTPKYGGDLARPVGSFAEMPTELDVARTDQARAAAAASRAQSQRDRVPMSVQEFEAFSRMPPEQQAAFTAFRASQRPTTTIQMPPGESAFAQKIGAGLGAQVVGDIDAARNAPNVAARANSVLAAVNENKAFMGPAADFKLQLARALNVSGKGPSEQIAATETLIADLKQSVIEAIKASNLGTGNGFTNKDLEFLVNAKAADIAKDPRTLQEFAERAYKTAQEAAKKGNARLAQNQQVRQQAGVEKFDIPEMVTVSRRSSVRRGEAPGSAPSALNIPKAYTGDPALWQYMSPEDRALWKD